MGKHPKQQASMIRRTKEGEGKELDLEQSTAKVLEIPAEPLKEARSHGLVTADAVLCSSHFDDDRPQQSQSRIESYSRPP